MSEEEKVIDLEIGDDGVARESKKSLVARVKEKGKKAALFIANHKTETIAVATIAVPAVIDVGKMIAKRKNLQEEMRLKDKMVYDRKNGHYLETKVKPTGKEWLVIDQRRNDGESLSEILNDLNLLK